MHHNGLGSTNRSNNHLLRSPVPLRPCATSPGAKYLHIPSPAFRQGGRGSKQVSAALDALSSSPARVSGDLLNGSPQLAVEPKSSIPNDLNSNTQSNHSNNSSSSSSSHNFSGTSVGASSSGTTNRSIGSPNNSYHCHSLFDDRKYVLFNGRQSPCFARVVKEEHEGRDSILLQPLRPSFMNSTLLIPWEGHLWSAKRSKCREVRVKHHSGGEIEILSDAYVAQVMDDPAAHRFVYPTMRSALSGGIAALDDDCDVISLESSDASSLTHSLSLSGDPLPVAHSRFSHSLSHQLLGNLKSVTVESKVCESPSQSQSQSQSLSQTQSQSQLQSQTQAQQRITTSQSDSTFSLLPMTASGLSKLSRSPVPVASALSLRGFHSASPSVTPAAQQRRISLSSPLRGSALSRISVPLRLMNREHLESTVTYVNDAPLQRKLLDDEPHDIDLNQIDNAQHALDSDSRFTSLKALETSKDEQGIRVRCPDSTSKDNIESTAKSLPCHSTVEVQSHPSDKVVEDEDDAEVIQSIFTPKPETSASLTAEPIMPITAVAPRIVPFESDSDRSTPALVLEGLDEDDELSDSRAPCCTTTEAKTLDEGSVAGAGALADTGAQSQPLPESKSDSEEGLPKKRTRSRRALTVQSAQSTPQKCIVSVTTPSPSTLPEGESLRPPLHPQTRSLSLRKRPRLPSDDSEGLIPSSPNTMLAGANDAHNAGLVLIDSRSATQSPIALLASIGSSSADGSPLSQVDTSRNDRQAASPVDPIAGSSSRPPRRARTSSAGNHRDAFLLRPPSRNQSAASGDWTI